MPEAKFVRRIWCGGLFWAALCISFAHVIAAAILFVSLVVELCIERVSKLAVIFDRAVGATTVGAAGSICEDGRGLIRRWNGLVTGAVLLVLLVLLYFWHFSSVRYANRVLFHFVGPLRISFENLICWAI